MFRVTMLVVGLSVLLSGCSSSGWDMFVDDVPPCPDARVSTFKLETPFDDEKQKMEAAFWVQNWTSVDTTKERHWFGERWVVTGYCDLQEVEE